MAVNLHSQIGSQTNTHGVEGLEHCHFLKSIGDARLIRRTVIDNFERACLPCTSDEERKKLLSFVICGGGPTGVEFAAELYDMLNEDLVKQVSCSLHTKGIIAMLMFHSTRGSFETKSQCTLSSLVGTS